MGLQQFSVSILITVQGRRKALHSWDEEKKTQKYSKTAYFILNKGRNSAIIMTFMGVNFNCRLLPSQIF